MRVFFGTNRQPVPGPGFEGRFANAPGNAVTYGSIVISVPRFHRRGQIERPGSFVGYQFRPNPEKHFMIRDLTGLTRERLIQAVAAQTGRARPAQRMALLFVHGFNVPFDDAAYRTAQISYDIGFKGAPLFCSWPSRASATPLGYTRDGTQIDLARPYIKRFIADIVTSSSADRVIILAHSMGTRGVSRALEELARERPEVTRKIDALILAAPDIPADLFRNDIAPRLRTMARETTLYASHNDIALQFSYQAAGAYALGDARGGIRRFPGMISIDASGVRTDMLGHSAYGDSPDLLRDIGSIFAGRRPAQRPWLRPVPPGHYRLVPQGAR